MKNLKIFILILASVAAYACVQTEETPFDVKLESDQMTNVPPEGGIYKIKVNAQGNWTAMTGQPWITISPANGRGSVVCDVKIDSALKVSGRNGQVTIELATEAGREKKIFDISQAGYPYSISLEKNEVEVKNYDLMEKRKFSVIVNANTDFDVSFVKDENGVQIGNEWISFEKNAIDLSSGMRPRNVKVNFKWEVNSKNYDREAKIQLTPKGDAAQEPIAQVITIKQPMADPIEEGTPKGDAQALIAISRSIQMYASTWDIARPLSEWENVSVWTEDDIEAIKELITKDPRPEYQGDDFDLEATAESFIGRVRYVMFYIFATKESIPFEVKYLTAAEEVSFYGNANSFLYDLTPGEHIASLTQLKRLQIVAYGLKGLDDHFTKLRNLEHLDLGSNNFEDIPSILTPENFPQLHSLDLGANQRNVIYDLSNTARADYGGLSKSVQDPDNGGFPERLLRWEKLDTLSLSVNYLWGAIPTCEGTEWPKYEQSDIDKAIADKTSSQKDTIGTYMIGMPKILPNAKCLRINLNRLSGALPDWILYHPCLDLWMPDIFIFNQEGTDPKGQPAKFTNVPVSLDDYGEGKTSYYEFHKFKKKK